MVTGVNSTQSSASGLNKSTSGASLDRDVFLRLLTTELSNQDPMSPMQDKDFISQLAQFSSLEQSQTLNQNMASFIQSQTIIGTAALVGKNVHALDPNSGETISGKVDSIKLSSGQLTLQIGNNQIPLESIIDIS